MHCRQCDYPLWNLTAHVCPECGSPFKPSEFEFAPNAVRFQCPHCAQAYYGQDSLGHLVPRSFTCSCGRDLDMDEMVLLPASGLADEQTKTDRVPWLERREIGLFKAWMLTIGLALVSPGRLMRGLPAHGSPWAAWTFAILTNAVITLISTVPLIILAFVFVSAMARPQGATTGPMIMGGVATIVGSFVFTLVAFLLTVLLWGAVTHVILRATGETAGGLDRTFQALCYSSGANVTIIVPFLGWYFGWMWWIVSAVLAMRDAQRVSGRRAAGAVLPPILFSLLVLVSGYAGFVVWAMSMARTQATAARTESSAQMLADRISAYRAEFGVWPDHALRLVVDGDAGGGDFIAPSWSLVLEDVPVGDMTLGTYLAQGKGRQREMADTAAAAFDEATVAHRLGDYVFTWHGVAPALEDRGLWVAVLAPETGRAMFSGTGAPEVMAIRADGTVTTIPFEGLPTALAEQNALRAQFDLAPLPDPMTISHDSPARADE